jgi:hypothetical protein
MPRRLFICLGLFVLFSSAAEARVVKLRIDRREVLLKGKAFGSAGAYEKLVGTVEFALDPGLAINRNIVDLKLAPRNERGEVEFSADFYILKPVDPAKGNGRLLYEVGNRGGKAILVRFQGAKGSRDPASAQEIGDGRLMQEGYTLAWMGWQWDVPNGQMRMNMPIATDRGKPITGLVRGNFIPNDNSPTQPLADRNHRAYPIDNPDSSENFMTVRDRPTDPPRLVPRAKWHFAGDASVTIDGGFELGRIYDVVYRARDPRVVGTGLAGTRDFVSFLKNDRSEGNPVPGIRIAYGWGVSQSGRFLRHFLYEGFNEDEQSKQVFDGVIDEVGGAGRGSFNHRFAQASRDAEEFFNVFYPVDMFPFTDGPETDPETGKTDSLLARAEARHVAPKIMHILSNSEYFNRAGSLIHTDPAGKRDIEPPSNSRIYFISSGPHFATGPVKPAGAEGLGNPLIRDPIVIALLKHMDAWVVDGTPPPPSRFPHIADGTLVPTEKAGWPTIPGVPFPVPYLKTYRLDFGPRWGEGIVDNEPPKIGKPFVGLVPAVDENGNSRAGIRMPAVEVPVGTYGGWNFRAPSIGAPDQLLGENGSFHPFPCTKAARTASGDSRASIEERYASRQEYLSNATLAAQQMVKDGFLLPADLNEMVDGSVRIYDWVIKSYCKEQLR